MVRMSVRGSRDEGTFKPLTPLTRQAPTQAAKASKTQDLLTVRARGRRTGWTDGQGRIQTRFMHRHCSRYVGESRQPSPPTACSHLTADALPLHLGLVLGPCVCRRASGTDQRPCSHALTRRERGGPHPVLMHAECRLKDGRVCDCHYRGEGTPVSPDSD